MRLLFGFWLASLPLLASATVNFRNDREGTSYYSFEKKAVSRALDQLDASQIGAAFDETLAEFEPSKLCSFDVNASLLKKLKARNSKFNQLPGAIIQLRHDNEMDDTVVKILLTAFETTNASVRYNSRQEKESYLPDHKTTVEVLALIGSFEKRFMKSGCLDEAYKGLYGEMMKVSKGIKNHQVESLYIEALNQKLISLEVYQNLEKARSTNLQNNVLTLKAYYQKLNSLRIQFPVRDPNEQSNWVTQKVDKQKLSRRTRLLENYTDLQIMLMGNVIKKLRERLESPKIEILVYNKETLAETITLDPMERFRFAIRILRKEMAQLSLNTYFEGRMPDYLDLMAAAYETSIIPASELDELAGLQDIWNPKKTWWEKARVWVNLASSVATVVIPPPYGFIPALALIVIEATTEKSKNGNEQDPTSLF